MTQQLWHFLLSGIADADTGIYGNVYAYGGHLGEALENAKKAIPEDLKHADVVEASFLENFGSIEKNTELVQLNDLVYMRRKTQLFPLDDTEFEFIPPVGIVKAAGEDKYDYDLIMEHFVAFGKNENDLFELELVVSKAKLVDTFLLIMDVLPSVDGFWIYVKDHWEKGTTELWLAKHFTEAGMVKDFLLLHTADTIENGYLDIVVHSLTGETNLTLDEHKKIQLFTKDLNVFQKCGRSIMDAGFEQTKELYNLEEGFHHWHYRPANSLPRKDFLKMLKKEGFECPDK